MSLRSRLGTAFYFQTPPGYPGALIHGRQPNAPLPFLAVRHRLGIKASAVILNDAGNISILLVNVNQYISSLGVPADIGQGFLKDPVNIDLRHRWKEIIDAVYLARFPLNMIMFAEIFQEIPDGGGEHRIALRPRGSNPRTNAAHFL